MSNWSWPDIMWLEFVQQPNMQDKIVMVQLASIWVICFSLNSLSANISSAKALLVTKLYLPIFLLKRIGCATDH